MPSPPDLDGRLRTHLGAHGAADAVFRFLYRHIKKALGVHVFSCRQHVPRAELDAVAAGFAALFQYRHFSH